MGIQQVDKLNQKRHDKRKEVKLLLSNLCNILNYINFDIKNFKLELTGLIEKLNKDTISISVVSEVSSGKSTFLNALVFNQAILESKVGETTAKIFNIKYGYTYSINGVEKENIEALTQQVAEDNKFNLKVIKESKQINNIQSVITLPNKNLKKGIELYDTPGFATINEASMLELIKEAISKSDATILLLDISQGIKSSERLFVKNMLHRIPLNKRFIVLNKYDSVVTEDDLELKSEEEINDEIQTLIGKMKSVLQNLQKDESQEIETYHISAKKALVGKIKNDAKRIKESRFDLFEDAFWDKMVSAKDELFNEHLQLLNTLKEELKINLNKEKEQLSQKLDSLEVQQEKMLINASEASIMSEKVEELKVLNKSIIGIREREIQKLKKELIEDITNILSINLDSELSDITAIDKLMFWGLKSKYKQKLIFVLENARSYIKQHLQEFIEEATHRSVHKKQHAIMSTINNSLDMNFSLSAYKQKQDLDQIIDQAIEKIKVYVEWNPKILLALMGHNIIRNDEKKIKHSFFELTSKIDTLSSDLSHFLQQSNTELQKYSRLSNTAILSIEESLTKENKTEKEIKEIEYSIHKLNTFSTKFL